MHPFIPDPKSYIREKIINATCSCKTPSCTCRNDDYMTNFQLLARTPTTDCLDIVYFGYQKFPADSDIKNLLNDYIHRLGLLGKRNKTDFSIFEREVKCSYKRKPDFYCRCWRKDIPGARGTPCGIVI